MPSDINAPVQQTGRKRRSAPKRKAAPKPAPRPAPRRSGPPVGGPGSGMASPKYSRPPAKDVKSIDLRKKGRERNVKKALKVSHALGANRKARKALIAAMGTESNYENLKGGDRDSQGVLQVRAQMHGSKLARSVPHSVYTFMTKGYTGRGGAIQLSKTKMRAEEIAQAVQGSGPNDYHKRTKEAEKILQAYDTLARVGLNTRKHRAGKPKGRKP